MLQERFVRLKVKGASSEILNQSAHWRLETKNHEGAASGSLTERLGLLETNPIV